MILAIHIRQFKPGNALQRDLCFAYIDSKDGNLLMNNSTKSIDVWTGKGPEPC